MGGIVSDSTVIMALAKAGLMEAALRLPHEFIIPDVMFEDELLDLAEYTRDDLIQAGLRRAALNSHGVRLAYRYAADYHNLHTSDCFALALVKTAEVAWLLTANVSLSNIAVSKGIETRDLLWLCDEMNDHETVGSRLLHDALVQLDEDPLVWLPRSELSRRIQRLAGIPV